MDHLTNVALTPVVLSNQNFNPCKIKMVSFLSMYRVRFIRAIWLWILDYQNFFIILGSMCIYIFVVISHQEINQPNSLLQPLFKCAISMTEIKRCRINYKTKKYYYTNLLFNLLEHEPCFTANPTFQSIFQRICAVR